MAELPTTGDEPVRLRSQTVYEQCGVHGSCRQPVAIVVLNVAMCDAHWKRRCADEDERWEAKQRAKVADDVVSLAYVNYLLGDAR